MEILFVLLIPILIAILSFIFFKGITWKEFLIHLGVNSVIAVISILILFWSNLYYTEVWNGNVTKKKREEVSCRHSYDCHCYTSCSGSGNSRSCSRHCSTCYEHSYDVDWDIYDSLGERWSVNTHDRQGLVEPHRWTITEIGEPTSHTHQYKNYLKASKTTIYKQAGAEDALKKYEKEMPEYPIQIYDYYKLTRLVNVDVNIPDFKKWNERISYINGTLGAAKQCNAIIVTVKNKPVDYFYALIQHWKGANKNDIVLAMSVGNDYKEIEWAEVYALTQNSLFQIQLKDDILALKEFDMEKITDILEKDIKELYKRKRMRDFEYLTAEITPEWWQVLIAMIIGCGVSGALAWFFEQNDVFGDEY